MSDSIIQKQDDDKEEKKTISELRNEIEEMKQRIKEQDELLQRGEKRPRETTQVLPDINITVGTSSSPFQRKLCRIDVQVARPERPKSYPYSIGDDHVVGIEEDVQRLVKQLINPQSGNFLAIVGMGGSGKTTLARKIYNHEDIGRYFDCMAWICVSQVWSEESLLKDIFSQITGQNNNSLTVTVMVKEIHDLLGDKLYLVILDDVWEPNALRKIMMPIARPHGSKFVITTRNRKVTQFSDLNFSIHEPRPLTHDQSLELFKKIAFGLQTCTIMAHMNDPFVDLAENMLRECDGLPLAVITLAGLLRRKKTIQEWMKVRDNVSSKIIEDYVGPSDYGRVEDILGLSYSDLDHILKSCFMYLSIFQEDDEISCGMLMRCWIAEGFFKSVRLQANETIEDVASQYLDELIQRCLVQIVKVNYDETIHVITVHDLLREFALKRVRAKYFCDTFPSNSSPTSTMQFLRLGINSEKYRDGEELVEDLDICMNLKLTHTQNQYKASRRLRSFIHLNSFYDGYWSGFHLKTLFTNYTLLRVLFLRNCGEHIPDAIGSLIHLRYLRLEFVFIEHLPDSIQNLRNLLSFDFRSYGDDTWNISGTLPNLKQMKQLRYLRLPWELMDYKESSLNLHHLRNLKVLSGIPSGKWMATELKYSSTSIEKLGIYDIEKSEELKEVYQCPSILQDKLYSLNLFCKCEETNAEFELQKLQHCTMLKKLCLDGKIAATGLPFVFPPYLLKLVLGNSRIDDQDSFAHALQSLSFLKVLKLTSDAYVGGDLTFPANSLWNLDKLEVHDLEYLKIIHVMEGAMPHLKSFYVTECSNLEVIHVKEGAMPHLKSFNVFHCGNFEVIHVKEGAMLHLKSFYIYHCGKLEVIHVKEGAMPHLTTFKVYKFHDLKVLWGIPSGKWMMETFNTSRSKVEKLGIIDIKNSEELDLLYQFLRIVRDNLYALKLKLKTSDTKFELLKVEHCTKLKKLYLDGVIAAKNVPFVFPPNLLMLELERSGLDDRDSFANALQMLTCLKVLKLTHSAYVGVDLTFPANSLLNLEKLQLYELEELERIHVMEGAMPHLKYLYVDHCHKLKEIPQCLRHLVRSIDDIKEGSDGYESYDFEDEDEDEDDMFFSCDDLSDDDGMEEDGEVNKNGGEE